MFYFLFWIISKLQKHFKNNIKNFPLLTLWLNCSYFLPHFLSHSLFLSYEYISSIIKPFKRMLQTSCYLPLETVHFLKTRIFSYSVIFKTRKFTIAVISLSIYSPIQIGIPIVPIMSYTSIYNWYISLFSFNLYSFHCLLWHWRFWKGSFWQRSLTLGLSDVTSCWDSDYVFLVGILQTWCTSFQHITTGGPFCPRAPFNVSCDHCVMVVSAGFLHCEVTAFLL